MNPPTNQEERNYRNDVCKWATSWELPHLHILLHKIHPRSMHIRMTLSLSLPIRHTRKPLHPRPIERRLRREIIVCHLAAHRNRRSWRLLRVHRKRIGRVIVVLYVRCTAVVEDWEIRREIRGLGLVVLLLVLMLVHGGGCVVVRAAAHRILT